MKRLFAAALISLVATIAAFADGLSATATATATGQIITPLSITKTADLRFGIIISGPSGNIYITPYGDQFRNNVEVLPGNVSAAQFVVAGEPNRSCSLMLPTTGSVSNGTATMSLYTFVSTLGDSNTGTLSSSGTQTVGVGGNLGIAPNQAPGVYTGTSLYRRATVVPPERATWAALMKAAADSDVLHIAGHTER